MGIDAGVEREIDVVDREVAIAVDEIDAARADAVDRGNVELHHFHLRRHDPCAAVDRVAISGRGIAHAQREGRDRRYFRGWRRARLPAGVRVDDDVHVALPVEQHFAGAMARDRVEADHFQNLSERLRLAGRELDELDAVHPQRIGRAGDQFTVGGLSHDAFPYAIATVGAARRPDGSRYGRFILENRQ